MRPHLSQALLLSAVITACNHAAEQTPASPTQPEVPRQGEYADLTKWCKYPYAIADAYPFVKALPRVDQIPTVIAALEHHDDGDKRIPSSQLSCLTRVSFARHDFDHPPFDAPKAWRAWWEEVGKDYLNRVEIEGKRNPEAWKLLIGDHPIPCPEYKVLIPAEWYFEISFRTGDYGSVQREVIRMERTRDLATLKRHFSVDSRAPFKYEMWHGFTPHEADRFLYGLSYAVDQPWFVKKYICLPPKEGGISTAASIEMHPGRHWGNYYASTDWTGIMLPDGRMWWNDDPSSWNSNGKHEYEDISLDACKLIYPFLCHHYPETPSASGSAGWESDPLPPPVKDRPKNDWDK